LPSCSPSAIGMATPSAMPKTGSLNNALLVGHRAQAPAWRMLCPPASYSRGTGLHRILSSADDPCDGGCANDPFCAEVYSITSPSACDSFYDGSCTDPIVLDECGGPGSPFEPNGLGQCYGVIGGIGYTFPPGVGYWTFGQAISYVYSNGYYVLTLANPLRGTPMNYACLYASYGPYRTGSAGGNTADATLVVKSEEPLATYAQTACTWFQPGTNNQWVGAGVSIR
jgi:hypothetical protein